MRVLRRSGGSVGPSQPFIGRFSVTGVLGSGATATVYAGRDPTDGSPVAIKALDRSAATDPALVDQLRREADALRAVEDRHCVRVVAVVDEPPVLAIVTELVRAATLRDVLAKAGRLSGPQALVVLRGALLGLIAVHAAGLVHGDVKPTNLLIDRHGEAMLIDFGLARPAGASSAGALAGSPAYMSPEQIRGDDVDARSDVYACGAVLFELLTGRRPYLAATVEATLHMHVHDPVPDPRAVDPAIGDHLANVCITALAKDPAQRFQSAQAFLDALEEAARERFGAAWLSGASLGALTAAVLDEQAATTRRPSRRSTRTRRLAAAGGAAATIAVVVGAVAVASSHHHRHLAAAPRTPSPSIRVVPTSAGRTTTAAAARAACTAAGMGALLAPPALGDIVIPADGGLFGLDQYVERMSLQPARDRQLLTAAGFRCGIRRFAQSRARGETVYIEEVRDLAAARTLVAAYARESRNDPSQRVFPVPGIPGGSGEQAHETGGITGGSFYENDVLFACGDYFVQVGFGYPHRSAPTDAITLARQQKAALGGDC